MALVSPRNTLDFHLSRPLTSYRDMSYVPLKVFCQKFKKAMRDEDKVPPETEALWFYGLNHCLSIIQSKYDRYEPMSEWDADFVDRYYNIMAAKAVRAFYYLVMICVREVRHNQSLDKNLPRMTKLFSSEVAEWFHKHDNESHILKRFQQEPPDTSLGHFFECVRWQFYNSKWLKGYGGKAWGEITDCLLRFIKGETSPEIMLDTIWTLSHNNGPIFNKGHFYSHYSSYLVRILDVQRSGQIPEAILHDKVIAEFCHEELITLVKLFTQHHPNQFGDYVDWYKVEALGALYNYPKDKEEKLAKYGMTESIKKYLAEAEKKKQLEAEKKKQQEEDFKKNYFIVMPGVHVKKFQRAA